MDKKDLFHLKDVRFISFFDYLALELNINN